MIANRHSREDYIEPVTSRVQVEQRSPYIFFCRPDNVINGLWFYREADCTRIHGTLSKLINISSAGPSPLVPFPELPQRPRPQVPEIMPTNPPTTEAVKVAKPAEEISDVFQKLLVAPIEQPQVAESPSGTPGPILRLLPQNKSVVSLANFSPVSNFGSETDGRFVDDHSDISQTADTMLNKEQLAVAVTHLIETDNDFLQKLHQAYADAMNKQLQDSSK